MTTIYTKLAEQFSMAELQAIPEVTLLNQQRLPSWFNVSDLVSSTMSLAWGTLHRYAQVVNTGVLDMRLANLWFGFTLKPQGWEIESAWDNIAGDYQAQDGWIRLHTNAPHHKAVVLQVLGCDANKEAVQRAVSQYSARELETQVVKQGGCAAAMNSMEQWRSHPVGNSLQNEPQLHWTIQQHSSQVPSSICAEDREANNVKDPTKPLACIKVLDLTRVLAGPVATRFLAAFGADVLRIDPMGWHEPSIEQEVTLGKRCARLDLTSQHGREIFDSLLSQADILVHGYRSDVLPGLGYSIEKLQRLNSELINVCLNAYGWNNDWVERRGFDSLVQMSSGIAHYGMEQSGNCRPVPLPVQALDHATGYIMAAAAIQALELKRDHGVISQVKTSLASVAELLLCDPLRSLTGTMEDKQDADFSDQVEETSWGDANRIKFPFSGSVIQPSWPNGAVKLGTSQPLWQ